MTDETKTIDAIAGPYRGQRLTVSAADFDQAIADKWAVDPFAEKPAEPAEPPPPLSDEEREAVIKAAYAWQAAQVELAKGPQPKEGGEQRDMTAEQPALYQTRAAPPPPPPPRTRR